MADTRLNTVLAALGTKVVSETWPLTPWRIGRPGLQARMPPARSGAEVALPHRWRAPGGVVWFHHRLRLDPAQRGRPLALLLDAGEGLLHVNGRPFQGLDGEHRLVLFDESLTSAATLDLALEVSGGFDGEPRTFASAAAGVHDARARRVVHGLSALRTLCETLPAGSRDRRSVEQRIGQVLDILGDLAPGSVPEPRLAAADAWLQRSWQGQRPGRARGLVHLVGQSHIDVVWLWTVAETRRKCARTFSTALRLLDTDPRFAFTQSQALLYEFVRQDHPELFEEIGRRVADGRWHVTGATWVEPDCNIPNGESLARHLLYGQRFFRDTFGRASRLLWLPDTFGYAWSLPQILRQSGVTWFFTTKLRWNDTTRFPHDSFVWKGIDGSEVLAHIPPVGLEGLVTPAHLARSWVDCREKPTGVVLQTFGFGDGGGGPTLEHLDAACTLEAAPGLPRSRQSDPERFFTELDRSRARLPVWRDELYLELHRGTYTTHAWIKRANRQAEVRLYTTELLCTLASLAPAARRPSYPRVALERLWKHLLFTQFHDIVPGTAIAAAYEDARASFREIEDGCAALTQGAARRAFAGGAPTSSGDERSVTVFNPLPWARSEYLEVPTPAGAGIVVRDEQGQPLPIQRIAAGRALTCVVLPPLGSATVNVRRDRGAGARRARAIPTDDLVLDTPLLRVQLSESGTIQSLIDKRFARELVGDAQRFNAFETFRDEPRHWDAWDIDPEYESKRLALFDGQRVSVIEQGPLRWRARVTLSAPSGTRIEQDVLLHHASPRIDFHTRVRWRERRTLLKVAFPVALRAREATYEIPFGAIARTTRPRTKAERARWEVSGQQWADVSAGGFGLSLLNDGKYGYDCRGATLRLTLIRSPHYPHPVEPMTKHDPRVTDQGRHEFTYALLPHRATWREAETVRRARELNTPVVRLDGRRRLRLPAMLAIDAPGVIASSVKRADETDAVVVRLFEAHGVATAANVSLGFPVAHAREADLLEHQGRRLPVRGDSIRLSFRPFEIKTLLLVPASTEGGRRAM